LTKVISFSGFVLLVYVVVAFLIAIVFLGIYSLAV
jgi:hypothetical protein